MSPAARCEYLAAMAALTSWQKLDDLAGVLERQAGALDDVLARLRREHEASRAYWRGAAGDTFRNHTGPAHRQHHLEVASARLRRAARLARAAAEENRQRATGHPPVVTGGGEC